MRMRRKHNLDARMQACMDVCLGRIPDYTEELSQGSMPLAEPFDASRVFGNDNPVHLEIGCGKGGFIQQVAEQNPEINFVAVEQTENVLVTAMERTQKLQTPNLRYLSGKAEYLEKIFAPCSVQRIYLNFSCPFPKESYAKHRLSHPRFLHIYDKILAKNGEIRQKTDNQRLFEFSIESYSQNDWRLRNVSLDLHNSRITGNIITEYERRFTEMGMPIFYLEAYRAD